MSREPLPHRVPILGLSKNLDLPMVVKHTQARRKKNRTHHIYICEEEEGEEERRDSYFNNKHSRKHSKEEPCFIVTWEAVVDQRRLDEIRR